MCDGQEVSVMEDKLWLIKDKKGRIFGPYTEGEVCFYIEEKEFKGEEFFSSYPSGRWKPLSTHPVFYKKILSSLHSKSDSGHSSSKKSTSGQESLDESISKEELIEPTRVINTQSGSESSKNFQDKKIKIKLSKEFKKSVLEEEGVSEIIEMEDIQEGFFDKLKQSFKVPLLAFLTLFLVVCAVIFFVQDTQHQPEKGPVHLFSVDQIREPLSPSEKKAKLKTALALFLKGGVPNYLKSQTHYIRLLESHPEEKGIYLYLCLTYLELWPFSHQDRRDKNAIKKTIEMANEYDSGGFFSAICRSVQAFINKAPAQSLMITDSILNPMGDKPPPFYFYFYYMKAQALKALNKTAPAGGFIRSINKTKPKWTAPYLLSGKIFYEHRKYDLAIKSYQKVLDIFPGHDMANLRMGILEYKILKKFGNSEKRLRSLLVRLNYFVPPDILIEAYLALANIYIKRANKVEALKYANLAYTLDPENSNVNLLKSQLGEKSDSIEEELNPTSLIYKGDMLVDQGDCSSAKKYFKKAYNVGGKKNAQAAFKLAQCYWLAGAFGQAIRWLKRAINVDGQFLEAYFLLSRYLAELYDFENAKEILKAVKSQKPSNYDLFKAYAFLYFHKKEYSSAVAYAERALKFYTSDIDLYVLLSRAYRVLGQAHKSFSYAEKAVQNDMNSISAQIAYAYALDLAFGSSHAIKQFKKLIDGFEMMMEYPQALGEYYFEKGMYDMALDQFSGIIEKDPKFKPAYIYLGRIYDYLAYKEGKQGEKYQQALRYFLEASLLDISDPEPVFYVGQAHLQHENYKQAEAEFEKILQINSNYPLIHYYIGLANFHQQGADNLKKALKFAKVQSAKTPNNFLPYQLAGDIYRLKSKGAFSDLVEKQAIYKLCVKEYQKAAKYFRNNIDISIGLIECYKGAGDLDSALQLAEQLVRTEELSGHPELYKEIGIIYEIKDQYYKARSYYSEYFNLRPGADDRKEIESRIERLIKEKRNLSNTGKGE